MWFDTSVFGDSFVSIPNNAATSVSFANVGPVDATLFAFASVVSTNDTLQLISTEHLYFISAASSWQLAGFVQQIALGPGGVSVSGGQLFGNISLHKVSPASYFNLIQPIAGQTQGQIDYMVAVPETSPYSVNLTAYQNSGSAKNLQRGVIAAVAFPLA